MIELKNISFKQYVELDDRSEYDYAINFAFPFKKPIDHLNIGDFMKLKFGLIKDLQYDLSVGLTWEQFFEYVSKVSNHDMVNEKLIKVCQIRAYFISEIERISEIESIALAHESTEEEEQAGIGLFKDLGIYMQIRTLTGGDVTKNELVRNMPYEDCFLELVARKQLSEYERALNKIYLNKQKN